MNFILACVCILTIRSVNACNIFSLKPGATTIDAPYYFGYNSTRGTMSAILSFDNNFSSAVEVYSVEHRQAAFQRSTTYEQKWKIEARQEYYVNYQFKLEYEQIILEFMFATNASCFDPVKIFDGIAIDRHNSGPGYEYDDRCLRSEPCIIKFYLQEKCPGATSVTTDKPQKDTTTEKAYKLQKGATTVTTDKPQKGITTEKAYKLQKGATTVTTDKPQKGATTVTTDKPQKGATSVTANKPQKGSQTSILVIVLSSIFSIVFIVLVIIVIWISWIKQSPQGTLGVQTNHTEPFYQNMLFRRECDQEIAEIDQYYEEIIPEVVEGSRSVQ